MIKRMNMMRVIASTGNCGIIGAGMSRAVHEDTRTCTDVCL